jgi:hypothetical protein
MESTKFNSEKFNKTIDELELQAEDFKRNNNVLAKISSLATKLDESVINLEQGNSNFNLVKEGLRNSLKELNENIQSLERANGKLIDKTIDSNKKFLRDFDDAITSRLDRFSSDIQVTIRQERTGLQESLQNNIVAHFTSLENRFNERMDKQTKKFSLLLILVSCSIGLCAIILTLSIRNK